MIEQSNCAWISSLETISHLVAGGWVPFTAAVLQVVGCSRLIPELRPAGPEPARTETIEIPPNDEKHAHQEVRAHRGPWD